MEAMDFPNLGLLAPRRSQTVSPLQSLVLFNHDFVLFHCRHLARRLAKPDPMKAMQWGGWRQIGPFKGGDFHELHSKTFPPEDRIDLKAEYSGLRWQSSELKDGIPLALAGENRVFYFHRSVRTAHPTMVELSLGSDDSIRIWLNGKAMLERKIERGLAPDQEKLTVELKRGQNDLLVKIVNGLGPGGIYIKQKAKEANARELPVTAESVDKAFRLVHQRVPSPEERSELLSYASKHGLAAACRLLFNSNEFLFLK